LQNALTLQTSSFTTNSAAINWHFNLDNSLVQYLADGGTITVTYSITVKDDNGTATDTSAAQTVTVVITGTNDTPVITAVDVTGAVKEDTSLAPGNVLHDTGSVTFADVDATDHNGDRCVCQRYDQFCGDDSCGIALSVAKRADPADIVVHHEQWNDQLALQSR
jgi:VCBS repeat-containing protein